MQWLDITIIAVLLLSVITGLTRGFVKEVMAIITWTVALWAGLNYITEVQQWLYPQHISESSLAKAAAFAMIVLSILFMGSILATIMRFILKSTGLSLGDRVLGMGFGFVRGVFIICLGLIAIKMTAVDTSNSKFYPKFIPLTAFMQNFLPGVVGRPEVGRPEKGRPELANRQEIEQYLKSAQNYVKSHTSGA